MGAEIDRLDVHVEAEAKDANKQLDDLAAKIGLVAKALSSISNMSGFKEVTSKSKQVAESMSEISTQAKSVSQAVSKSMENSSKPMQQVAKTASEIAEKYKDLGKDFQFFGSINSAEKQIEKYSNALETAKLKKAELEATGKTEGQMYEYAIRDIQKYSNMIDSLKGKLNDPVKFEGDLSSMSEQELDNWFSNLPSIKAQAEQAAQSIKESFEQIEEPIRESFALASEPLKELDLTLANFSTKATQAFVEPKVQSQRFSDSLEELKDVARGIQERFLELKGRMENTLVSKGLKTYTSEHVELQNQITKTEKTLATLNAQLARSRETVKNFEGTTSYRKMQYDIAKAREELTRLRNEQDKLETSGGATKWNFSELSSSTKNLQKSLQPLYSTLKKVSDVTSKFAKRVLSIILPLKNLKKSTDKFHGSLSGGFKTILKYGIGIESIRVLFNKLRSAMADGMKNLVQYSDETNASVSLLMNSINQLKNASAAAIAPLLNAIAPALNKIIQLFVNASNAVNQFFSALLGKGTWIRAKKLTDDYASSISDAAKDVKGALQPFDALNNLTTQDKSGTGTDPSDMFETVPIESKFKDLADWIKDMWDKADFYDLGKLLGEKLKDALENIPWSKIKKAARKLGKSLASLINGFIEVENLGYTIGKTLAEALNTAFEFLNAFVHELHWESVGKFIADQLNGFFENIDWELIRDTFVTGFKGLADSINSFVDNFNWDNISNTISNSINVIAETVYTFFSTVDFGKIGKNLGEQLRKTVEKIDWYMVGKALGSVVQSALDFLTSFIKELDMSAIANAIRDTLKGFLEEVDMSDLADVILALLALELSIAAGKLAFDGVAKSILGAIKGAFASSAAVESAASIGTSIGNSILAGMRSVAIVGGSYFALDQLSEHLEEVAEATGRSTDQARRLEERYEGFSGKLTGLKDAFLAVKNGIEGYGFAADTVTGQGVALEKALEDIANGAIYTDDRMAELQERFSITNEDIEMLRQATLDANPELRNLADRFTELNGASVETLEEIRAGLKNIEDGIVPADEGTLYLTGRFGELTEATKVFFDNVSTGATSLDEYKTTLDNVSTSTEQFSTKMNEAGQNIGEGILNGMRNVNAEEVANEFYNTIQSGLEIAFDMHSPAKKMEPSGSNILLGILEGFKSKFDSFTAPIAQLNVLISSNLSNGLKTAKNAWTSIWNSFPSVVSGILNSISNTISKFVSNISGMFRSISSSMKNIGGNFSGFSVPKIKTTSVKGYATGGFPEDGLFFANHNELVGQFSNGKTAVANNEQITQGISIAVQNANSEQNALLREQNALLLAILEKDTGISEGALFNSIRKSAQEYNKRTGQYAFT